MAKTDYIFENIKTSGQKIKDAATKSLPWFRDLVKNLGLKQAVKTSISAAFDQYGRKKTNSLNEESIGGMFAFIYDPKWKAELPYYDNFPLIFPIEMYEDRFLGINFHYLPPALRAELLKAMYTDPNLMTENERKKSVNAQLKLSYAKLLTFSKLNLVKPCIKMYLKQHVRSNFIRIPFNEWDYALLMPRESFAKKSKYEVWRIEAAKMR